MVKISIHVFLQCNKLNDNDTVYSSIGAVTEIINNLLEITASSLVLGQMWQLFNQNNGNSKLQRKGQNRGGQELELKSQKQGKRHLTQHQMDFQKGAGGQKFCYVVLC